jgi:hypothetical protein
VSSLRPSNPPSRRRTGASAGPPVAEEDGPSIVRLVRDGTLDADLASLLWLLLEARVPVVVAAGPQGAGKTTVLTALLEFLPPAAVVQELRGYAEDFGWMPEAARLGWRTGVTHGLAAPVVRSSGPSRTRAVSAATGYLVAAELSAHRPGDTWGEQARIAVRALSQGYGLGATIHADSLEEVLSVLGAPDVRLTDDELTHLGVVLILRAVRGRDRAIVRRISSAHYVRPISRDAGGHVQRMRPAVLAAWDPAGDSFEHFAWGIVPELAARTGRRAGDFEAEHARRRDLIAALAAAGVDSVTDVRAAIDGARLASPAHRH